MKPFFTFFLLAFLSIFSIQAQQTQAAFVEGELIVQLLPNQEIEPIITEFRILQKEATELRIIKKLSEPLNIWHLSFNHNNVLQRDLLTAIFHHRAVKYVQNNHYTRFRSEPNDPQYDSQWQYDNQGIGGGTINADIDAPEAWDITTGGITPLEDTIVVAVVDDGLDLAHQDFGDNRWVNHAEIPNNGVDDDENGYIDDYLGWNTYSENDNIEGGGHGTPVAGIIGAKGNNQIGVAGVNWNVKLMVIVGGDGTEANVIASYSYAYEMRLRYNQSNGEEGAYVVVTNSSWGVDFGQPEDSPIWCGFYDDLGAAGILSCGATINNGQNVDIVGDLPTGCTSDYLISVTNMDYTDAIVSFAGYGATSIDLGAFGQDTWTVAVNNSYGGFGGTSGATPHVAGAVALLYSAPCTYVTQLARSNPGQAALLVKSFILDGAKPNGSLDGITVTGGKLNLKNSLDLMLAYDCNAAECFAPYGLHIDEILTVGGALTWYDGNGASSYTIDISNLDGELLESVVANETSNLIISLSPCTDYEVTVATNCQSTVSNPSIAYTFTTEGCCKPPNEITILEVSDTSVELYWNPVVIASEYIVGVRPFGTNEWENVTVNETYTLIENLNPCLTYEVQVTVNCGGNTLSDDSEIISFTTLGCGNCVDLDYCIIEEGADTSYEWIQSVNIASIDNDSGDNNGFGNFTNLSTSLKIGNTYLLTLEPGYSGDDYSEYWRVWIDFNQDGLFDDQSEMVVNIDIEGTVERVITIPQGIAEGNARMRVSMMYIGFGQVGTPMSCENVETGETEDYCVSFVTFGVGIASNEKINETINVYPNPFTNNLSLSIETAQKVAAISIKDVAGRTIKQLPATTNTTTNIPIVLPSQTTGIYFVEVLLADGQILVEKVVKF